MPNLFTKTRALSLLLLMGLAGNRIASADEQKIGSQATSSQQKITADSYFQSLKTPKKEESSKPLSQKGEVTKSQLSSEPAPNKYPIRAGDKLNIQVYREKDLTGIFVVDNSGGISYPLLGVIDVQGKSLEELREYLKEELEKDYLTEAQVQVDFEQSLNKTISILGQVNSAGNYPYTPDMTIVRLVSKAGGFTAIAAPKHVQITRKTTDGKIKTFSVNVDAIMAGRAEDFPLEAGDLITVPESFF